MSAVRENPFAANYGEFPPYLAGRAAERELISEQIEGLANRSYRVCDITLVGPRGTGKTVLLEYAEQLAMQQRPWFSGQTVPLVVRADASCIKRKADVLKLFLSRSGLVADSIETGFWGWRAKWSFGGESLNSLFQTAIARCKRHPLVLLIDEAQELKPKHLGLLLRTAQTIRQSCGSFQLILAGTPELYEVLYGAGADFHERGPKFALGLLEPEAAADAIRIPLAREGISIHEDSLRRIVADSQCYPYFLQAWGKALWVEADKRAATAIDDALLDAALPEVSRVRRDLYEDRIDQWKKEDRQLLVEIAKAVKARSSLSRMSLTEIIQNVLVRQKRSKDEDDAVTEKLVATDFLWKPRGSRDFIPGIPSLVSYVIETDERRGEQFESVGKQYEGVREPIAAGGLAW